MLIVPIKEGEPIEKALKKFKKKFEKTGVVKELRERQKFTKPSVRRRETIKRAIFREKFQAELEGLI
jgi:small subunit ribosomal protein S21